MCAQWETVFSLCVSDFQAVQPHGLAAVSLGQKREVLSVGCRRAFSCPWQSSALRQRTVEGRQWFGVSAQILCSQTFRPDWVLFPCSVSHYSAASPWFSNNQVKSFLSLMNSFWWTTVHDVHSFILLFNLQTEWREFPAAADPPPWDPGPGPDVVLLV